MQLERPILRLGATTIGGGRPFLLAGPCVLEAPALVHEIAERLLEITAQRNVVLIFKASFDKANRSSGAAVRGPGLDEGLALLREVKQRWKLPLVTDVHLPEHCAPAAEVVDILQIPAFLCRQTDLLQAAAETGRVVNVKKGQFLAPWDMRNVVAKLEQFGNPNVLVTERGTSFGYGRLIVDMTGFEHLRATGKLVVFDATHSVQEPGARGDSTGGNRELVPALARAAMATGNVDGLFFEVHPDPDRAPSDGPNMVRLERFPAILDDCLAVHEALARRAAGA